MRKGGIILKRLYLLSDLIQGVESHQNINFKTIHLEKESNSQIKQLDHFHDLSVRWVS